MNTYCIDFVHKYMDEAYIEADSEKEAVTILEDLFPEGITVIKIWKIKD